MALYYCSVILANCLLLIAFIYGKISNVIWNNKQARWHLIYLGFILGIELITKSLIFLFNINNTQSIYPFYVTGEFIIMVLLLLSALKPTKKWVWIALLFSGCIFIEGIVLWLVNDDASTGYGKIFSHLIIICMTAYLLIKHLKEFEANNPLLVIYAALFLYFSVSLFLFLLMNQLTKTTIHIWTINNLLSCILYGSSIYTFYRLKKSY